VSGIATSILALAIDAADRAGFAVDAAHVDALAKVSAVELAACDRHELSIAFYVQARDSRATHRSYK
jgi:hypothetical protein